MKKHESNPSGFVGAISASALLFAACIGFAVSCSGGGSGSAQSSSTSTNFSWRMRFKPAELYNVRSGDEFAVSELGGDHVALRRTQLTGTGFQELEVEFKAGRNYVFAVYSNGAPYVRSLVTGSQISAAKASGTLNVGDLNALTTYFTGLLEMSISGSRMQAGATVEQSAMAMLQKHFQGVGSFSELSMDSLKNGSLKTTDAFKPQINRINLMTLYLEQVGSMASPLAGAQASAMAELFAAICDTTSANNLLSKLSSPALPQMRSANALLPSGRSFLDEVSEQFITDSSALGKDDLRAIFWEPQKNPQLAFSALHARGLGGVIAGSAKQGVTMELRSADGGTLLKTDTTRADGSFGFEGLDIGKYRLKPLLSGHVFKPSSYTVDLDEDVSVAGFNFTSFVYVKGSTAVPRPTDVLSGIQYTSADGQTPVTGSLSLPKTSEVWKGAAFGPGGGLTGTLEDPPQFYVGSTTSASFVIELH